jgi:hypothetical protein
MNQQQAIERAQQLNAEGKLDFDSTHVAKDEDGQWFGYDQEPELNKDFGRWESKGSLVCGLNWDSEDWEESRAEVPVGEGVESEETTKP